MIRAAILHCSVPQITCCGLLKVAVLTGATLSRTANQSTSTAVIPGLRRSCSLSINVDWCSESPFVYSPAMNSWPI